MNYHEWKDFAVTNYDLVSRDYNKKVYEAMIKDPDTKEMKLIQLSLREVLAKCEGTVFEKAIREKVMKCVYTGAKLNVEIRKVMDIYYGI